MSTKLHKLPAKPCMLLKVDAGMQNGAFVLLLASVLPSSYLAQVIDDHVGLP